jgi:[NiFe] hydrogenase diaphorase moiety large subunit
MCGADGATAVQIGGPSGRMVGPAAFDQTICYDDLATGGSVMVFGPGRNVVDVAHRFTEFFCEESCGYCTPCRVGNELIREKLEAVMAGHADASDLDYMVELGKTMKLTSRCGLGQTAPNPALSSIENFRPAYEALLKKKAKDETFVSSFDILGALTQSKAIAGRESEIFN